MTKSKPVAPKRPKPVLAWCVVDRNSPVIRPGWCAHTREIAAGWTSAFHSPALIRVEIRLAPKRKGAKP